MPDEVTPTGHAGEKRSLREHEVRIGIRWRRNIRDHSREGVQSDVKDRLNVCAHLDLVRFPVLFYPHPEIRKHFEQVIHTRVVVV